MDHVLVVDDEVEIRNSLEEILREKAMVLPPRHRRLKPWFCLKTPPTM